MTKLIQAEIFARRNSGDDAHRELQQGLAGFADLGIEEGLNYEYAGRILRLLGNLQEAEKYLRRGIEILKDFPMYQAALFFELSLTLLDQKKRIEAEQFAQQAIELYQKCEAPLRIIQINNVLGPLTLT